MIELKLAWRYLKPRRDAVSVITCISLIGVMLGVAVLIVVNSVMDGFNMKMQDTLLSTISHIQISNPYYSYITDSGNIAEKVRKGGMRPIPIIRRECIIQNGKKVIYKFLVAVDASGDKLPFNLNERLLSSAGEKKLLGSSQIMISRVIAEELGVKVGDKIYLHSPARLKKVIKTDSNGSVAVNKQADSYLPTGFTVSALFSFDKRDFDKAVVFVGRSDAAELYGYPKTAATNIYVWTDSPFNLSGKIDYLTRTLHGLSAVTWKQLERRTLEMLSLQKVMLIFLLAFIVLVASVSILCTLITVVVQKRKEIGIMKAVGCGSFSIVKVFSFQGTIVGAAGTVSGVILGFVILHYRNDLVHFASFIAGRNLWNPEFYFFKDLPALVNYYEVAFISLTAVVLCTLGALIPALLAAFMEPAKAMRSE